MVPGLDIESLNAQGKLISRLERFELEGAIPKEFDLAELFHESEQTFFCVQGLASFWNGHAGAEFGQHVVDLVIGAHNQRQVDLTLVMLGTPQKLAIYISLGTEQTTRTLLEGMFPGIILESISPQELAGRLPSHFTTMGILTGIPGHKAFNDKMRDSRNSHGQNALMDAAERQEHTQLERVIRGMYGATWAYVVQAHPRPPHKLVEDRMKTINLLT